MKNLKWVLFCLITSIVIVLCLGTTTIFASSDETSSKDTTSKKAPDLPSTQESTEIDPAGYWTEEKMKNATPADEKLPKENKPAPNEYDNTESEKPGNASDPVGPKHATINVVVPSTAGKVFFSYQGNDYVCSASAINNDAKNLIITAGHCVHGGSGEGWHSNIAFAPAYYDGDLPYGLWNWQEARTFNGWINDSNFSYDQAFVTVRPSNGENLIHVVGGNGLSYGYSPEQQNVRIFGWPAEDPYDGERPYYCDGDTYKRLFSSDAYMNCDMNGGASGGPWLREIIDEDLGYVFAVTSRRSTSGTPRLYATPNSQAVKDMFDLMD